MWRQVCLLALVMTVLCAADHNREDRQPRSADTFWIGGRYGRSLRGPTEVTLTNNRVVRHAEEDADQQKTNRFYLTNRYGKRAGQLSDRLANRMNDRFGDRWKKQIVCDCVPREHYKRSVFRVSE
ncbi:uncharacterized protein LOC123717362 [Pieris brassicae]|uniref:uncharacterized protein LOC123717362 n=1 Tax=Pieris brassicae TaxID=7116 RepID=UPI001E662370|nr:uncharacterized protein LOC123717362 [Pieris brassicae]XP_045529264.1 uncharacterized protein LOC123717362 [Pieris brassicae]